MNRAHTMIELAELLLVSSSVAVSLALSRFALGELFCLVRIIDSRRPHEALQG